MFNLLFYFYPRSPCGERQSKIDPDQVPGYFYPRSPCGERRVIRKPTTGRNNHFYPRSPCGERHRNIANRERQKNISIHALLAESDELVLSLLEQLRHFYPRSPCGERHISFNIFLYHTSFLSTLSLRRATRFSSVIFSAYVFLSTLSLRRATGSTARARKEPLFLSTLSLRRATALAMAAQSPDTHFYPRSPCGERLIDTGGNDNGNAISIHALLAESDGLFLYF